MEREDLNSASSPNKKAQANQVSPGRNHKQKKEKSERKYENS